MRAIEEEVVWPELAPLAEAQGYRMLAVWENGFRHVTNNLRPIETPTDLAGVKLRTPAGVWRVRLFQALGANPTPMALSEVFVGLQTRVIDGQENPLAQIWGSKLQEVQRYLSLTGHVYTPAYVVVSPARWAGLPEGVRAVLEEEARGVQAFVHQTAARLDEELLGEIGAAGVEVNTPGREAFVAASRAVYQDYNATVPAGEELIRRATAAGSR
jgi:tripartite ATP-independent transporter DctP family solute receptor